ncbi:MAG: hypothetical protein KGZ66_04210 [Selenomonadales bacterium]|jgi:hypothetical protein|nr:hypothetical protein [Selenomonadales bacterium]
MLKKLVSAIVVATLLLSCAGNYATSFAQRATMPPLLQVNEYDVLQHIKSLSDEELMAKGYTKAEIIAARAIDYGQHLRALSKLDTRTLRRLRYTEEQISLFRRFDGSDEQMRALAATLFIWAGFQEWHYEPNPANNSWVRMWVSWAWSGVPGGSLHDRLVLGWSHGFRLDRNPSVTYASVNYYYESVFGYWATETVLPSPDANHPGTDINSAEFVIDMRKGIRGLWCRALDGSARIRVFDPGPEDSINLFVSYGHRASILALTPGWSILGGFDVSINWAGFWVNYDYDAGNLNIFTGAVTRP